MKLFRGIVLILLINYRSRQHHFKSNSKFMKNWKRWIAKTHILSARLRLVLWTVTRYMSRLTGGGEHSTTGVVTTVGISSQWGGAMPVVTLYSPQDIKVGHYSDRGREGLWGFLWWAPSAVQRKDHNGVSSGWSSIWLGSNTGPSSTQYEQVPNLFGIWPFWLTKFFG